MKKNKYQPTIQGAAIGCAAALIAILLYSAGMLGWLESKIWDISVRHFAKPSAATEQICTIMIDQRSLDDAEDIMGITWKWPREIYGAILSFCQRGGAKSVAFDMIYTERSDVDISDDVRFGEAIAATLPTVVALPLSNKEQINPADWPPDAPQLFDNADVIFTNHALLKTTMTMPQASFPVPQVTTNVTLLGNVTASPDSDAIFRRISIGSIYQNHFVPGLGLAAYLAAHPKSEISMTPKGFRIDENTIPIDSKGNAILRYRGNSQTHLTLNAAAVLQSELRIREGGKPSIDPAVLKGRYVFFGLSALGLMDLKPTPMGRTYPGVEVHATFLDNFLANDFATPLPLSITIILTIIAGLVSGILGRNCKHWHQTMLLFIIMLVLPPLSAFAAYPAKIWFPVAPLETATILALLTAGVINYAIEGHQKRFIKGAFKQYLSPIVIEKLMQDPDRLQLGGEEKTLSIFFSDIQGFTSISESLTPTELTHLLNTYLTAMTNIIHDEGGTIDKYEGDAIIAFWNAPLEQRDHAKRAVRATLRCQAKLAEMRPALKEICGRDVLVRIGLNTGPVVVGNMGSDQRFDYTFLGDAGNLAARLEGINKQFGTFLMISEFTLNITADAFPVRELSRVTVVGKSQPITIYEPFLPEEYEARKTELEAFDTALQLYYAGKFSEAAEKFSKLAENDPPAKIYAKRCEKLAASPPQNWQGIWNITEK